MISEPGDATTYLITDPFDLGSELRFAPLNHPNDEHRNLPTGIKKT